MPFSIVLLTSDLLFWGLIVSVLMILVLSRHQAVLQRPGLKIMASPMAVSALVVFGSFFLIAGLDSIHFQSKHTRSVLDQLLYQRSMQEEQSYSAPFATTLLNKSVFKNATGDTVRGYAPLQWINQSVSGKSITKEIFEGLLFGGIVALLFTSLLSYFLAKKTHLSWGSTLKMIYEGKTVLAIRSFAVTIFIVASVLSALFFLSQDYHILGTDKVGEDVFYETMKSIRSGVLIGSFTIFFMLPFALFFGLTAGYFGGIFDDFIQFVYTVLSSVPGVLLISAAVLALQLFIARHPATFPTLTARADARLLALCMILGVTSWTSLCRLLRAETLKIRELDYVTAAHSLGVHPIKILWRHVMPNIMHIVIITIVLDFSSLVLAEAVLSYLGVGVDPTMMSWGNMINSARLELAREPVIWWPMCAAFIFMFILVLSLNLFADKVRDAFDPRVNQS